MAINDDPSKPRNLLGWRDEIAAKQAERGLTPDPVPTRVTTITAPGTPRGTALVRDALNPQNLAANRAEALPFANQVSGPRFTPEGTGSRQMGALSAPPPRSPATPAAAMAAAAAPAVAPVAAAKLQRGGAPKAGAPGVQFNTGQPGDVQPPTQPNIGYFIGSDGKRRDITANQADALASRVQTAPAGALAAKPPVTPAAAAPAAAAPMLARPTPTALAQGVADGVRGQTLTARNDAAQAMNPMSLSGEMMRRLQHSQTSYANKGSPSARAFAAEAILGQLRAGNNASASGQAAANAALQQGAAGEVAQTAQGAALADAQAARESSATLRREELDASAPILQLQGGNTARVGRDGVVRSLVGEDGAPVRGQADVKSLDPNEVFKAAAEQRGGIVNNTLMTPEARAAALAEFDAGPLGQALSAALPSSPQGANASPIPEAAIAYLRANPKQAAAFEQQFRLPAGAAAQYLGN